ncbi:hypothetical protein [Moraxella lacunata]
MNALIDVRVNVVLLITSRPQSCWAIFYTKSFFKSVCLKYLG